MTSVEIKRKLIREIELSTNNELLAELYRFLNQENEVKEIYTLSTEQKQAIKESRDQVKKGEFLTKDQANDEIDRWLIEKNS